MAATKIRWDRMGREKTEITNTIIISELDEEEEAEDEAVAVNRMFNIDTGTVDAGYVRCTGMKTNRRVIFPPGRDVKEESVLETRIKMWRSLMKEYMKKNCD